MGRITAAIAILSIIAGPATPKANIAPYYLVFLRPAPSRKELPKAEGDRLQSAHMANIQKMARDGVLAAAGPFDDTPITISGMFLFKMDSLESAQSLAARDPTVLANRDTVDVHAWQGPPGIGVEYFRLHTLNPTTPDNMQARPLCLLYRGTAWDEKRGAREKLLTAHERYIDQLHHQGKLGAAGAMRHTRKSEASGDLLGLVIFKPNPLAEAQRLLQNDPAVQAGVLRVDLHTWWSSDHVLPW